MDGTNEVKGGARVFPGFGSGGGFLIYLALCLIIINISCKTASLLLFAG